MLLSLEAMAQQKHKDPFIGMDRSEVIKQFGQPTTVEKDSIGEQLIYKRERSIGGGKGKTATIGTHTDTYVFQLDSKGKVYAWKLGEPYAIKTAIAN
jgi:hypothetical protein